jgi:hypothetical protein
MDFTQEKCPICYETFNYSKKPYLLLLCGHTFCNPCISRIKKECLEDDSKYKTLSEFYSEQKKKFNLCDSQTSVFSDNCKKKSFSEKDDSENIDENEPSQNISHQSDSYIELDENEEIEDKENPEENKNDDKNNEENNRLNDGHIFNSDEIDYNDDEEDENEEEE